MKIKVVPLAVTVVVSAALLFGGWSVYRHFGIEKPLDQVAESVPGVESAEAKMTAGQVVLYVKLSTDADLVEVYRKVKREGAAQIGSKKLELVVESDSSSKLDEAWSHSLFDVAEAMETRRYSGIRSAMEQLSERFPGVTAETDMDDDNVYIRLSDGQSAKYIVLPRQPISLGVWADA